MANRSSHLDVYRCLLATGEAHESRKALRRRRPQSATSTFNPRRGAERSGADRSRQATLTKRLEEQLYSARPMRHKALKGRLPVLVGPIGALRSYGPMLKEQQASQAR